MSFTWLNDLSFDEMLGRVAKLPPRSFIFLGLLLRDAAGVTHNEDDALKSLHAVANAPINGVYQNQLGLGIVGGRLYQAEAQGVEAARVAVRILRGEPVSNFPPQIIGPGNPRYDWRELQRWGISEARLPPGSDVRYRAPTLWEQYRWGIVASLGVLVGQTLVVVGLLFERRRRRRAQAALEDRLRFETLLTEISAGFADPAGVLREPDRPFRSATRVDEQVREGLRRIAQGFGTEARASGGSRPPERPSPSPGRKRGSTPCPLRFRTMTTRSFGLG